MFAGSGWGVIVYATPVPLAIPGWTVVSSTPPTATENDCAATLTGDGLERLVIGEATVEPPAEADETELVTASGLLVVVVVDAGRRWRRLSALQGWSGWSSHLGPLVAGDAMRAVRWAMACGVQAGCCESTRMESGRPSRGAA